MHVCYDKLYLVGRSMNQYEDIEESEKFEEPNKFHDPNQLYQANNNLVIFDDVIDDKQATMSKYFTRGRHNNVNVFYISQNYFKLPRQTIRENSNLIILFKQTPKSCHHIYHELVSTEMSRTEFD